MVAIIDHNDRSMIIIQEPQASSLGNDPLDPPCRGGWGAPLGGSSCFQPTVTLERPGVSLSCNPWRSLPASFGRYPSCAAWGRSFGLIKVVLLTCLFDFLFIVVIFIVGILCFFLFLCLLVDLTLIDSLRVFIVWSFMYLLLFLARQFLI